MLYHITKRGEPALCKATVKACPFGPRESHHSSKKDAFQALEQAHESLTFSSSIKVTLKSNIGEVTVIDGDLDNPVARVALSTGLCAVLALAIHEKTGARPYFLINDYSMDEEKLQQAFLEDPDSIFRSSHVVVESLTKEGCFIDSFGQQTEDSFRDFWEDEQVIAGSAAMLEHYAGAQRAFDLSKFAESAIALDQAGEAYSYSDLEEFSDDDDDE